MKKIIALLLSILMVCSLAACASKQTNVAFPPYEFYENEKPAGIDVEIATAICEKLGYKLDIMDIEFGAILGAVSSGKADFTMAGLTVTDERKQSVDFSTSYATGIQSIVVKEDSPITSADDLYADGADYQIGVQQDTTGDIYCSDDFGDDHVQRFNEGADAVAALVSRSPSSQPTMASRFSIPPTRSRITRRPLPREASSRSRLTRHWKS